MWTSKFAVFLYILYSWNNIQVETIRFDDYNYAGCEEGQKNFGDCKRKDKNFYTKLVNQTKGNDEYDGVDEWIKSFRPWLHTCVEPNIEYNGTVYNSTFKRSVTDCMYACHTDGMCTDWSFKYTPYSETSDPHRLGKVNPQGLPIDTQLDARAYGSMDLFEWETANCHLKSETGPVVKMPNVWEIPYKDYNTKEKVNEYRYQMVISGLKVCPTKPKELKCHTCHVFSDNSDVITRGENCPLLTCKMHEHHCTTKETVYTDVDGLSIGVWHSMRGCVQQCNNFTWVEQSQNKSSPVKVRSGSDCCNTDGCNSWTVPENATIQSTKETWSPWYYQTYYLTGWRQVQESSMDSKGPRREQAPIASSNKAFL